MKISIVTASYNYQDYIKETIQSVLDQTYSDWELIIVDDCSTDNSVDVIKSFNDERIKLFINEKNLGLKETLKRGIEKTTGEWIAFLESDDILYNNYLEQKIKILKQYENLGLIFNNVELFGDNTKIKNIEDTILQKTQILKLKKYPCNLFKELLDFNRILTFSSVMVKKEYLLNCDFNTPTDKLLDWWLFIHFAREYEIYYIPEKLTKWRIHTNSYIYKKETTYSYPINLLAYIDILKKEKKLELLKYIIPVFISSWYRLKVGLFQHIKVKLGIPLRGTKEF